MAITATQSEITLESIPLRRYEDQSRFVIGRRISWGAVFAGTAVGIVIQTWLAMLGVAVGVSTIDPLQESAPWRGIGLGSALWLTLSVMLASYIGGWITGKLSGIPRRLENALHGAVTWAMSNMVIFLFLGTVVGTLIGGVGRIASDRLTEAAINRGQAMLSQEDTGRTTEGAARQAGDTAAKTTAAASWAISALMFLGLCAGAGGAAVAAPRPSARIDTR